MSIESYKTVGIIGGMGPEATVELMRRVIEFTPANDDCDHIRMLVDNNPKVPSRIKALIDGDGESPLPELIEMAKGLENSGADFLVMPCNTAHHFFAEIVESVSIPCINMIDLTVERVKNQYPNINKIGLLASTATKKLKLYENIFTNSQITTIYPSDSDQKNLMTIIRSVKSKSVGSEEIRQFKVITNSLNVDCLVVACTELSIIADSLDDSLSYVDALDLLAKEIIQKAQ